MRRNPLTLRLGWAGLLLLATCAREVRRPGPLQWPRLPRSAVLSGRIWVQQNDNVYRGRFLLRYSPDSVHLLIRGLLGAGPGFRGTWEEAPSMIQVLRDLLHPTFCDVRLLCTPAGTLEVFGEPLPTLLRTRPGTLQVRITRWIRDSVDFPGAWVFQTPSASGRVQVESFRTAAPDTPSSPGED